MLYAVQVADKFSKRKKLKISSSKVKKLNKTPSTKDQEETESSNNNNINNDQIINNYLEDSLDRELMEIMGFKLDKKLELVVHVD